ncbi:MAG: PAS domain-containing protein [Nitrospirota bacterium]
MLALQFFGVRRGVLAAGMISLVTYLLWNHPYAIIILTCEALVVGLLVARRKIDLVTADALYWLCIGIPLVFLFYYGIMHVPLYLAEATMMKQAVNGIANALIARLLFVAIHARAGKKQVTFQEMLFNLLAFAVLTVSLFLLIHQTRHDFSNTDQAIRGSLNLAKQRMSANLDRKLAADVNVIAYLARVAPDRSPQAMQQSIEQAHAMDEDFLRIGVLDRSATVISFSPLIDDLGRPQMGRNYADRPFIPLLKRDRKPMLTDVEMSRFGAPRPRAGIVAPVLNEGRYAGYAIGVLDLERLREPLVLNAKAQIVQNLIFTLVDKHNKVIVTSRQGLKAMDPFARGEGELRRLDDGIAQWLPAQKKNISISERWKHSSYVAEQPIGSGSEWKLIVELPIAPFQQKLIEKYAASLTEVFALLLVALAIARHLSRSAASSLEQLAQIAASVPSRLSSVESLRWPHSMIRETRDLIHSFRDMAQVMALQFHKITLQNESLEQRINERTQELRESEERFRALIESTSDWIWEVDKNGRYSYSSPRVRELLGYAPEEVIGKTPFELMPPEEARRVRDEFIVRIKACQPLLNVENINLHKDGRSVVLETSGVPIIDAEGQVIGYRGIDRDITKRKRAEEEVNRLANEQQTILNTVAIGVAFVKDRKLIWTNPAYERIFGYEPGEARGLDAKLLYVNPADYERVGREGYPLINAGGVYTTEVFSARKDGRTFWLSLTGRAVNTSDITEGSIWMMQDVTERKQAELELQDKTRQLEALTRDLESRVEQEVALRRSNEQMLVQRPSWRPWARCSAPSRTSGASR